MPESTTTGQISYVPVETLRFGHEDEMDFNSRRTDRQRDIDALAQNLLAFGVLIPLVTARRGKKTYVVDGNKRLAALHLLAKGAQKGVRKVEAVDLDRIPTMDVGVASSAGVVAGEQELSLVLNTQRAPLHPVDQYEAFVELRKHNITIEQIAQRHGMPVLGVSRALALGVLSPMVRAAWRDAYVTAEDAKLFTLAPHEVQERVLKKLLREAGDGGRIASWKLRSELGIDGAHEARKRLAFVGAGAYADAGGSLTVDLFGANHVVHDEKMLTALAAAKAKDIVDGYALAGWKWAGFLGIDVPAEAPHTWQTRSVTVDLPSKVVKELKLLQKIIDDENLDDEDKRDSAIRAMVLIGEKFGEAAYKPEVRAQTGVILSVDERGNVVPRFGYVHPDDVPRKAPRKAGAAAGAKDRPKEAALSNALAQRLASQRLVATKGALDKVGKPGTVERVMAGALSAMIDPEHPGFMPSPLRDDMEALQAALDPRALGDELVRAFAAADYFATAPKALVIAAIKEMSPKRLERGMEQKKRADLAEAAVAMLKGSRGTAGTRWLPPELRTRHYAGPGAKAAKGAARKRR